MEDEKIIDLFFARSERAIGELSGKYGPVCLRLAEGILNDRRDAEECVNDAYLAVWNAIPPEKPERLLPYVCRVTRNLALKKYRAKTALKRNSAYDLALDEIMDCLPAAAGVEEEIDAKEVAGMINAFLGTLEPRDRILFVRRYWYADPLEELARLSHKSRHYVSVRLSRIRGALKQYLIKEGVSL